MSPELASDRVPDTDLEFAPRPERKLMTFARYMLSRRYLNEYRHRLPSVSEKDFVQLRSRKPRGLNR